MNTLFIFRVETKLSVKIMIIALALTMFFVLYKIHQDGGFTGATAPQWVMALFEAFALLMWPTAFVFATRTIDFTQTQIVVSRFFGLIQRSYSVGDLSAAEFIPSNGRVGDRIKLRFIDGGHCSVWKRDSTNWERLNRYLEDRNAFGT